MKKVLFSVLTVASTVLLTGCGGSSSSTSDIKKGTFIDNVVSGVRYINEGDDSSVIKYTDANGKFQYDGGLVEFFVGNIKIGEINSLPEDGNVFVQDLVDGVERTNNTDTKVLKIARLLQSLDSNPETDEIEINQDDFKKFDDEGEDRNLDDLELNTIFQGKEGLSLKTEESVKQHLLNTMSSYKLIKEPILVDTDAPLISDIYPNNNETDFEIDDSIVIRFNEQINSSTIASNIEVRDEDDNLISLEFDNNTFKTYVDFEEALDYDKTYTLTIKPNIEDLAGNKIQLNGGNTNLVISFTTESKFVEPKPEPITEFSGYYNFNQSLFDKNTTLYNVYKNKVNDVWDEEFSVVSMNFSKDGIKVAEGFSDNWVHTFTDYKIMENGMLRYEDDLNKDNEPNFEATRRFIKITRSEPQHLWVCYGDDYAGVSNCSSNTDNNEYLYLSKEEAKKRIARNSSALYGYEIFINDGDNVVNMEFWKHGTYTELVTINGQNGHTECRGTWEADAAGEPKRIVITSECKYGNFSLDLPSNFSAGDDVSIVDLATGSVKSREAFSVRSSIK